MSNTVVSDTRKLFMSLVLGEESEEEKEESEEEKEEEVTSMAIMFKMEDEQTQYFWRRIGSGRVFFTRRKIQSIIKKITLHNQRKFSLGLT